MQNIRRFALFVIFCLSFFTVSGCSFFLKSEADQAKTQQVEKKLTSEEVLKKSLENLQKAPGLHYTFSIKDEKDEVYVEQKQINLDRFCLKMENKKEFGTMQFCYEDPLFSVKLPNQPAVTVDTSSHPEQSKAYAAPIFTSVFVGEMGNPETLLQLADEGKLTMEEQSGTYVLKGAIPPDRYIDALLKTCQDHKLLNHLENFQGELKRLEDELKSDMNKQEFQLEIKVDRQKLQLKEIKMIDAKGWELKLEMKGEISDLDMNGTKL